MKFWLILPAIVTAVSAHAQALDQLSAQHESLGAQAPVAAPPAAAVAVTTPPAAAHIIRRIALDKSKIIFDDGDTIGYPFEVKDGVLAKDGKPYDGELRLVGFDTPETVHPHHGIFYDQPFGPEASALTKKLINEGKGIEVVTLGTVDYYGRVLAYLIIDGKQLGVAQIKAGLAYEGYSRYPNDPMHKLFPAMIAELDDAWKNHSPLQRAIKQGQQPQVSEPSSWRKKNQQKDFNVPLDQWRAMTDAQRAEIVARVRAKVDGGK